MRPHDAQTRNMPVLHPVRRLLFHFRQHIADYFRRVVGGFLGPGGVDGDVGELWPGEGVVEIVFAEVVFGQVRYVGGLHVGDVGGVEDTDVHGCEGKGDGVIWRYGV